VTVPGSVREVLEEFGEACLHEGLVNRFDVEETGWLKLSLRRKFDDGAAAIEVSDTAEVYLVSLDGGYSISHTAYDEDGKKEAIESCFQYVREFLEMDYFEEISNWRGMVVMRRMRSNRDGGIIAVVRSGGVLGAFGRLPGLRRTVVRADGGRGSAPSR
jgi:hypothetical protein